MASKTILSVLDPTVEEQPALERAAWLAKRIGADLELFICDDDRRFSTAALDSSSLERALGHVLEQHHERLREHAERLAGQGINVQTEARWDRPLDRGIVRKVMDDRPLLVVKDTHYHPVLKRTLFSNTDWNLIRSCPVPLLLVKPRPVAEEPTIVAAVDPMHEHDKPAELDRAILAFAKEIASALHGRLHVLHSYDIGPVLASIAGTPASAMAVPVEDIVAAAESEHRKALDALVADFGIDSAFLHLEQGIPHEVLVQQAAALGADIVVMGAVSRSGLKRIFVGSTAERALDRLPCDLLVIKPPAFTPEYE